MQLLKHVGIPCATDLRCRARSNKLSRQLKRSNKSFCTPPKEKLNYHAHISRPTTNAGDLRRAKIGRRYRARNLAAVLEFYDRKTDEIYQRNLEPPSTIAICLGCKAFDGAPSSLQRVAPYINPRRELISWPVAASGSLIARSINRGRLTVIVRRRRISPGRSLMKAN